MPPGWELNCMDDRDDSTLQSKGDHCIRGHEGSFGPTEVSSSHKTGGNVDNNLKLNFDLTLCVIPVERKHGFPHHKSEVQSAGGVKQARILTEREFQVPSPNIQDNNRDTHTDSRNIVNAEWGWSYCKAIVFQSRPVYHTGSVTLKENQQETPAIVNSFFLFIS
jgi:hypothetical protein